MRQWRNLGVRYLALIAYVFIRGFRLKIDKVCEEFLARGRTEPKLRHCSEGVYWLVSVPDCGFGGLVRGPLIPRVSEGFRRLG